VSAEQNEEDELDDDEMLADAQERLRMNGRKTG